MKRIFPYTMALACLAALNSCVVQTVDYFSVLEMTENVKVTNKPDAIELTRQR